jgi:hypothetical protein
MAATCLMLCTARIATRLYLLSAAGGQKKHWLWVASWGRHYTVARHAAHDWDRRGCHCEPPLDTHTTHTHTRTHTNVSSSIQPAPESPSLQLSLNSLYWTEFKSLAERGTKTHTSLKSFLQICQRCDMSGKAGGGEVCGEVGETSLRPFVCGASQ